jgi:hypothetical protein
MTGRPPLFSSFTSEREVSVLRALIVWCLILGVGLPSLYYLGVLDTILIMLGLLIVLARWQRTDVKKAPEELKTNKAQP